MRLRVDIIIPLYYASSLQYRTIKNTFDSIEDSKKILGDGVEVKVIVIDDGSPMDAYVFPVTLMIRTNRGYTATVNTGLEQSYGDIKIIANQDIIMTPELLERFISMGDGIYSPKTDDEGEGNLFGSIWGMNKETFKKMGPLNQELKHFFSDKEYYDRAYELGVPVVKWNDIVIHHEGGDAYRFTNKDKLYEEDAETYRNLH